MPKILRASEIVNPGAAGLESTGSAASIGLAQTRTGERGYAASKGLSQAAKRNEAEYRAESQAAMAALAAMDSANKRFKIQAQEAKDNSLANSAYAGAISEYIAKVGERASKMVGPNGLPTFDTLTTDAQKIGQDVSSKYNKGLSGNAATAFNENFNRYLVGHLPSVMETARAQQVEFGRASITNAISSISRNVGSDKFTNYPNYEAQVQKILAKGIQDGSLAPMDALKMQEGVRLANLDNINNTIRNNPERAVFELTRSKPEQVGLTKPEYDQAVEYAGAQLIKHKEALAAQEETRKRQDEARAADQQTQVFNEMQAEIDNRIATGQGMSEIPQMIASSPVPLTREQELKLSTKFVKGVKKLNKETEAVRGVYNAISSGGSLAPFTAEDMNTWYQKTLDGVENEGGFVGKLVAGANLVKDIPREIPDFTQEIKQGLNSQDDKIALVAAQMTDNLIRTNPEAVASLTSEEQALAVGLATGARYSGKEQSTVVTEIRQAVQNVPADERKRRLSDAKTFSSKINVKEILDNSTVGLSDLLGVTFEVDQFSEQEIKKMWEANYAVYGRKDLANSLTAAQATQMFGGSDLTTAMEKSSDIPGLFNWNSNVTDTVSARVMLNPPEKAPRVQAVRDYEERLRESLTETVSGILPEGVTVDDVVYSYAPNLGAIRNNTTDPRGTQYYYLMYLDKNNTPRHLTMPDGQFALWKVHGDILKQYEGRDLQKMKEAGGTPQTVDSNKPKTSGSVFKQVFAPPGGIVDMIIGDHKKKD